MLIRVNSILHMSEPRLGELRSGGDSKGIMETASEC